MAVVLTYGAGVPVVKVGRIAGQFAKPRSSPTERVGDQVIDSFRGHMVNDDLPERAARVPDPDRLVAAYHQSVSTLNLLRAFTKGGFADLSQVHAWNQEFVASSTEGRRFEDIAEGIDRALRFMAACGINLTAEDTLHEVDFWTSHEALILDYEEALTRRDSLTDEWYDCSAHMLWVGERTRQLDGAHCEFLSGIHNPVGSKVGPDAGPDDVVALCERLNPGPGPGSAHPHHPARRRRRRGRPAPAAPGRPGRGPPGGVGVRPHARQHLHRRGRARRPGASTTSSASCKGFFAAHREVGTWPGGVHVELTGDDVTECLGGVEDIVEDQLHQRYTTTCDPRLNARQSLDLAFAVAELLRG